MALNAVLRTIVIGCGLLALLAPATKAEESPRLQLGAWVRVTVTEHNSEVADARRIEGSVVALGDTTMTLGRSSTADLVIAHEEIALLEERVQEGRRLRNMMIGLISGAAIGAAVGFLAGDDPECEGAWCYSSYSAEDKALMAAVLLAPTAALLAAIAAPGEKWETIPLEGVDLRVGVGVSTAGRVFIAVSF
jgi:hypothetical protein